MGHQAADCLSYVTMWCLHGFWLLVQSDFTVPPRHRPPAAFTLGLERGDCCLGIRSQPRWDSWLQGLGLSLAFVLCKM